MRIRADSSTGTEFDEIEARYRASSAGIRPRVGYICLRVPPEYIEACGADAVRIAPRPGYDPSAFTPIRPDGCSFCRSVPAILETEHYKGLDAIIAGACCDQMRRLMDTLKDLLDVPVILYGAPRTWNADPDYFRGEMVRAFEKVSEVTAHSPTESEISKRIRVHNDLKETVMRLRRVDRLPTVLLQDIARSILPPEEILSFLKSFTTRAPMKVDIRLMLTGSIPGVWELEIIESNGSRVVADATCLGDRVFHRQTQEGGDPVQQLYLTYVEDNLCPHRRPLTPAIDYIRELMAERRVEGVVHRSVKYCHPWGLLSERMKRELQAPVLIVDDDLTSPAVENFRTRTGAFIEMLKMKSRRSA
jgi:benzoyl-CoA reductase/2-hydroxyglutaryl-CoA dehydratase subunit BcrC/BadD/HgdB